MRPTRLIFFSMVSLAGFWCACSSTPLAPGGSTLHWSEHPRTVKRVWSRDLNGNVTDLDVAAETSTSLMTLIPDYDRSDSIRKPVLQLYDRSGDLLWEYPLESRVRFQAMSSKNERIFVSTYDEKLLFLSAEGKVIQEVPHVFCRPKVLNRAQKLLCFYDDEANHRAAFDVFDWEGKKLKRLTYRLEPSMLKVSEDERHLFLGFPGGVFLLLDDQFKVLKRGNLPGEIIDAALSEQEGGRVAVLYQVIRSSAHEGGQKVALYNFDRKLLGVTFTDLHSERILITSKGEVALYGNSPRGQHVTGYHADDKLSQAWRLSDEHHADFLTRFLARANEIWVGLEKVQSIRNGLRKSYVMGLNADGQVDWGVDINTEYGAYLYDGAVDLQGETRLTVATDGSKVYHYRIGE